jgi:hypothetical protein
MSLDDVKFHEDARVGKVVRRVWEESWVGLPCGRRPDSLWHHYRLPNRKLAAGTPNHVMGGTCLHELEAVAERILVADQCEKLDVAKRYSELQANYFADWNFLP